ncbi:MAG TPA: phosphatase, partial [Gammaproteobacteria bacterium]|nr:phosphatase [Gammaproteobacteria bacterium]
MSLDREIEARFTKLGGVFLTPVRTFRERLAGIRGIVSDWDGVFNDGAKGDASASTYNEPDSMGTNLVRYALWRT